VNLPIGLTLTRIVAVPLLIVFLISSSRVHAVIAAAIFILAAITDWADGMLARRRNQVTTLGTLLDPIADKLLVGTTLLMLTSDNTINGVHMVAAVIILCREILVSGLREFLAELNMRVHVTQLAKWKTTVQMIALGVLLAGPAGDKIVQGITSAGLAMLWVAALLTLWTGFDYLKAAVRTAIDN
jgi:CDP-diacylglycerol--glycerol-3-phosphate 3-phosphatidyltransferase/cardiolipin synthase